jgi:hypothetical protein
VKSLREKQELKRWGGELISFAPTAATKFGLSDEHIRQACIQASVEASDAGSRVTATRVASMGVLALATKKKRPDGVSLMVKGDDYVRVIDCGAGKRARENAERFAARVNAISGEPPTATPDDASTAQPPSRADDDPLEQIMRLAELRDAGAITTDEFDTKKAELLRRV